MGMEGREEWKKGMAVVFCCQMSYTIVVSYFDG
jgi:hypothetical protein